MIEECESKSCCNFCCGKMYPFLVNMQLNYANNFTCNFKNNSYCIQSTNEEGEPSLVVSIFSITPLH